MSPQRNGIAFQDEIAETLLDTFTILKPSDIRSCQWRDRGDDIILSPAARRLIPYTIECKHDATGNYRAAYRQASRRRGLQPLVILKCNRQHMTSTEIDSIWGQGYSAVCKGTRDAKHRSIAVLAAPTLKNLLGDALDDFDIKRVDRCNLYTTFHNQTNLLVAINYQGGQLGAMHLDDFLPYLKSQ